MVEPVPLMDQISGINADFEQDVQSTVTIKPSAVISPSLRKRDVDQNAAP
jgi:hypothetical protein